MSKIIHSMIRVLDLDRSLKFYADCFDLRPSHRLDFPSFSLVYLRNEHSDTEIELTWNKGRTEPYGHGDGYGHVAFCVPDVAAERARLQGLGHAPLEVKEFKADEMPEHQGGAAVFYQLNAFAVLGAEYLYGTFDDEETDDRHLATLQLALEF